MSAKYNGLTFRTSLEAQWAAFFDLAGWSWWVNPQSVEEWQPDFKVQFPCGHSECGDFHVLFVSVLPIKSTNNLNEHPSLQHYYSVKDEGGKNIGDSGALFGIEPNVSVWEMAHGAGGGVENVTNWVHNANELWLKAKALIE